MQSRPSRGCLASTLMAFRSAANRRSHRSVPVDAAHVAGDHRNVLHGAAFAEPAGEFARPASEQSRELDHAQAAVVQQDFGPAPNRRGNPPDLIRRRRRQGQSSSHSLTTQIPASAHLSQRRVELRLPVEQPGQTGKDRSDRGQGSRGAGDRRCAAFEAGVRDRCARPRCSRVHGTRPASVTWPPPTSRTKWPQSRRMTRPSAPRPNSVRSACVAAAVTEFLDSVMARGGLRCERGASHRASQPVQRRLCSGVLEM